MMIFWNNLHQVQSLKDWKAKQLKSSCEQENQKSETGRFSMMNFFLT